ncbi:MAG: Arginine--tRNA ligase [Chloroflexi bacterium ADurb.Bin344]|nr:MAG: Arginine--tRNA ligase [Chloroflexi bacterium ADurb.Bin344]
MIKSAHVAGPGFINISLNDEYYFSLLRNILSKNDKFGQSNLGEGKSVNVEYISANPTGPLHIGNARSGPIGEMVANIYENFGYRVEREFYINDIGGQVNRLAETIYYWFEKTNGEDVELPENGYPGEYLKEISEKIFNEQPEKIAAMKNKEEFIEFFKAEGLKKIIEIIKSDIALLGIEFDKWFYQSELENSGKSVRVIEELSEKGFTAKKEGALWFKNPADPDLSDRESVLRKSDETGTLTYFADDIAYHKEKIDRGNEICIDVWGSNHHGHIPRLMAALKAIGIPEEKIKVMLYQYVRLKNGDEILKMGKRFGNFVTLRQVIEAGVSADAFKYFVVSQNSNTPIDFDIELAKERSEKNPVYYIEYAHARICSILRKAEEDGIYPRTVSDEGIGESDTDLKLLSSDHEKKLVRELAKYPDILAEILSSFQIQLLPHYAYKIAGLFHEFYTNCVVLSENKELTLARLALCRTTKIVIKNALAICDIEAPEKM